MHLDEAGGRPRERDEGPGPRRADLGPGRPRDARADPERHRRAGRRPRAREHQGALADPPPRAGLRRAEDLGRDVRDGDQGHRPPRAVHEGGQDGPLRRRGRRQNGPHPGAHQQRRQGGGRLLRLRRRRRADPRGERPLARDDRVGRHRPARLEEVEVLAHLRADDRAPGRAPPRRPDRPHRRRVVPRHRGEGRPPLHRQHLPLHAGGLGGLGPPRAHALRRRLPAEPRDRDGRAAGADHLDEEGLHHLGPGDLRPGRRPRPTRPRRPRSPTSTRRRSSRARSPSSASTRPSTRSPRRRRSSPR